MSQEKYNDFPLRVDSIICLNKSVTISLSQQVNKTFTLTLLRNWTSCQGKSWGSLWKVGMMGSGDHRSLPPRPLYTPDQTLAILRTGW